MIASVPASMPSCQSALAELRQDASLDDLLRRGVGQDRLEAVADLDPHLCSVGATISSTPLSLPRWPMCQCWPSARPYSSIVRPPKRGRGDDDELVAGPALPAPPSRAARPASSAGVQQVRPCRRPARSAPEGRRRRWRRRAGRGAWLRRRRRRRRRSQRARGRARAGLRASSRRRPLTGRCRN